MDTPLLLLGIAVLVGGLAGRPLSSANWTRHAPRLAVALWHALCFGVLSSVVLGSALLAKAVWPTVVTGGLSDFLARCAVVLRGGFAAPSPAAVGIVGLAAAAAILGRVSWCAATNAREVRRVRRGQLERLALAGRTLRGDRGENVVLLVDDRPAAYCLPDRGRGTIVISTGSLALLADDQVRMVLAHERAHLRQRHHVATQMSAALSGAFGGVPLFRLAAREVPVLLEMAADDQALRSTGSGEQRKARISGRARQRLGHALVTLATAQSATPAGVLAAAGGSAAARVQRLSEPNRLLGPTRSTLLGLVVLAAFAGPTLIASAPTLCAAAMEICPFVL